MCQKVPVLLRSSSSMRCTSPVTLSSMEVMLGSEWYGFVMSVFTCRNMGCAVQMGHRQYVTNT